MVTTLHVPLDKDDYNKLIEAKGERTWREFLLNCCGKIEANPQQESKRSFR